MYNYLSHKHLYDHVYVYFATQKCYRLTHRQTDTTNRYTSPTHVHTQRKNLIGVFPDHMYIHVHVQKNFIQIRNRENN